MPSASRGHAFPSHALNDQDALLRRSCAWRPCARQPALHPAEDRLRYGEQSEIDRPSVARRRAEHLDLAADAPVQAQHGGIEIAEDRLNAGFDGDLAQGRNQNAGSDELPMARSAILDA